MLKERGDEPKKLFAPTRYFREALEGDERRRKEVSKEAQERAVTDKTYIRFLFLLAQRVSLNIAYKPSKRKRMWPASVSATVGIVHKH